MDYKLNDVLLKKILKENKITYSKLADILTKNGQETGEQAVKMWFKKQRPSTPEIQKIKIISEIFKIPIDELVKQDIFPTRSQLRLVPIVGEASCGLPISNSCQELGEIYVDSDIYNDMLYAVIASGDSMYPEIEDGDKVVCDPRAQIQNGDLVHYTIFNESAIKVFFYDEAKELLTLKPINPSPDFQTKYLPKDDENFGDLRVVKAIQIIKNINNNRKRRLKIVGLA